MQISYRLKKIFTHLESPAVPLLYSIITFISAVVLRDFLEVFSDKARVSFSLIPAESVNYTIAGYSIAVGFLHYFMFWLVFLLSIAIIFYLITRENIVSILKVILPFSLILILTPGLDLLISGGSGFDIRYSAPKNLSDMLPLPRIVTPGMIMAILTGLTCSFLYCFIKTGKVLRGFFGIFGFYLVGQILGSIPSIIDIYHPLEIMRFLSIIFVLELTVIAYLAKKDYLRALFADLRWLRISHYWSMFILGILITRPDLWRSIKLEFLSFVLTLISIALAWAASVIFNNVFDIEIDKVSNIQRPLVRNLIPLDFYIYCGYAISFIALYLAFCVNIPTLFIILLCLGSSFLYSAPPFRFKRVPVFSKIFLSLNSLALVMLGALFSGREILAFPREITLFFLLITTITFNFIDLKDYIGDKVAGIRTLPAILGLKKAKIILGTAFIITYASFGLILLNLGLVFSGVIFGIVQFFIINKAEYKEKMVLITHLSAVTLLLIYLNFY